MVILNLTKLNTKQIKDAPTFSENSMLLKKESLELCKPRVLIYVQGFVGHPQAYGLHHSWIALGVVFLHSL
jgi:hypothetical protein